MPDNEACLLKFPTRTPWNKGKLIGAKAIELAERIATNAALSNFAVLQALPRIARSDLEAGLLMESLMMAVVMSDGDAKMRIQDFLQKRAAKVSHPEPGLPMQPFDTGE